MTPLDRYALLGVTLAFAATGALAIHYSAPQGHTLEQVAEATVFLGDEGSYGSGFYISDRYILTNAHVVALKDRVRVEGKNGSEQTGTVIWKAPNEADAAVLRVETPHSRPLRLRCDQEPEMGENVRAVGNPGIVWRHTGARWLPTWGQVLGKSERQVQSWLFSAVVLPGSSGGPVVDERGFVLGVTTFLLLGQIDPFLPPSPTGIAGFVGIAGLCADLRRIGVLDDWRRRL